MLNIGRVTKPMDKINGDTSLIITDANCVSFFCAINLFINLNLK